MRDAVQTDLDNFFHGILHYIFFSSGNCYNRDELQIEYRGLQPNSDPGFLLDHRTQQAYESGLGPGQCLVFTFHRIRLRPTAYAIKSGPLNRTTRHLTAYVLQGWDARRSRWDVIDERQMLLEYMPAYTAKLWHIDTSKDFQKFRLLQTDPAPPPGTHIAISAFEIHGSIAAVITNKTEQGGDARDCEFDPWDFPDCE
jgi:hypothetical protein